MDLHDRLHDLGETVPVPPRGADEYAALARAGTRRRTMAVVAGATALTVGGIAVAFGLGGADGPAPTAPASDGGSAEVAGASSTLEQIRADGADLDADCRLAGPVERADRDVACTVPPSPDQVDAQRDARRTVYDAVAEHLPATGDGALAPFAYDVDDGAQASSFAIDYTIGWVPTGDQGRGQQPGQGLVRVEAYDGWGRLWWSCRGAGAYPGGCTEVDLPDGSTARLGVPAGSPEASVLATERPDGEVVAVTVSRTWPNVGGGEPVDPFATTEQLAALLVDPRLTRPDVAPVGSEQRRYEVDGSLPADWLAYWQTRGPYARPRDAG